MNSMVLLPILLATTAVALYVAVRTKKRQDRLRAMHQDNLRRQEFLLARLDEIGKLMEDKTRSNAELQAAFHPLLAELMAADVDGTLAPLITDTEKYFNENLAKRQAPGTN